jgi:DnaJ-class molecular chaperone
MSTKKKKSAPSEWFLRVPAACGACEGSGRVWVLLRGANIQTTKPCGACLGFGTVMKTIKLSEAESRKIERVAAAHGVT